MHPGDPASWPLDQREKRSAKIVFEASFREESVFDVCLDYPTHDSAEPLQASKGKDSNFDVAC